LLKELDPAIEEWEDRFNIITPEEADQISALLDKLRESQD
jgi:hypothetical protein